MPLVTLEGFDLQILPNAVTQVNQTTTMSPTYFSSLSFSGASPGRSGGYSWMTRPRTGNGSYGFDRNIIISPLSTFTIGFAHKQENVGALASWKDFKEGTGIVHLRMSYVPTTSTINVYRGPGTALLGSFNLPVPSGWHHFEIKVVIHSTLGSFKVLLDSTTVLDLSNINTRNGGSGVVDRFVTSILGTSYSHSQGIDDEPYLMYIDDFYLADDLAPYGDCVIKTLLPNAVGDASGWTRSTGSTNWSLVDEVPPNTTDYVEASTSGQKDLYHMADTGLATGEVVATQAAVVVTKNDAGPEPGPVKIVTKSTGGVEREEVVASGSTLTTTYTHTFGSIETTDPNSDPLTVARVDGMQAGIKIG